MDRRNVSHLRPRTNRRSTSRRSWASESCPEDLPITKTADKRKIRAVVEKLASLLFHCHTLPLEEPGETARPSKMVTQERASFPLRTESHHSSLAIIRPSKYFPSLKTLRGIIPACLNPPFWYARRAVSFSARNSTSRVLSPALRLSRTRVSMITCPMPCPLYPPIIVSPMCPWRRVSLYLPRVTSPFAIIFPPISAIMLITSPPSISTRVCASHSASSSRATFLSNPEYRPEVEFPSFSFTSLLMNKRSSSRSSYRSTCIVTFFPLERLNRL